jgi:hypothetical protein
VQELGAALPCLIRTKSLALVDKCLALFYLPPHQHLVIRF